MHKVKKIILKSLVILLLVIILVAMNCVSIYHSQLQRIQEKIQSVKIYDYEDGEQLVKVKIEEDTNIGRLTIPAILLDSAPVNESTELNVLAHSIGHFSSTSLYYGNVGLAAHNGGTENANYFENLKNIRIGDEIYYETIYGVKKYIVKTKEIIQSNNWSYLEQTQDNRITLITCVRNEPAKRLCVQAIEEK